jgi:two-component system, NarL family, response regulator NreC
MMATETAAKIRVLIVDDHGVMRAGLKALIDRHPDLEVVGEAGDGQSGLAKVEELKPDVVVMDIGLPDMSGVDAIRRIRAGGSEAALVALTMHDDPALVRAVLAAGGSGYVVKTALGDELVSAILAANGGSCHITASLSGAALDETLRRAPVTAVDAPTDRLTPREHEVLELLAQGYTNQEIGGRLGLSAGTVGTHRFHIGEKLGLRNRADIIRYALETGMLGRAAKTTT